MARTKQTHRTTQKQAEHQDATYIHKKTSVWDMYWLMLSLKHVLNNVKFETRIE